MLHAFFYHAKHLCYFSKNSHVEHNNECYVYIMYDKTTSLDLLM